MQKLIMRAVLGHARHEAPNECCGLIVRQGRRSIYVPCENVFFDPSGTVTKQDAFAISSLDWMKAEDAGEVTHIVHSHTGDGAQPVPSGEDLRQMQIHGLPWLIVTPEGEHAVHVPAGLPLLDRPFVLGATDCYGLIMDWHAMQGVKLPDFRTPYEWWTRGERLYDDKPPLVGFVECEPNTPGAMVTMKIRSDVTNHGGIYLPDGTLLHHMFGQRSTQIAFAAGEYRESVVKWWRHSELPTEIEKWL